MESHGKTIYFLRIKGKKKKKKKKIKNLKKKQKFNKPILISVFF